VADGAGHDSIELPIGTRELLDEAIRDGGGGQTRVTLEPLLAALRAAPGADPATAELWAALERLHSRRNAAEVVAAGHRALRDLAAALSDEGATGAATPAAALALGLMAVVARDPELGRSLATSLARRDARSLSLTVELVERVLPASPLRDDLTLIVEAASDPAALRRAAREVMDRAPRPAGPSPGP
jgi:hypothetical protein